MSVPNQTPYNIYTANGLTTVFPYEFMLLSASDLDVSINGTSLTDGYVVQGVGNPGGGDVVFLTPPDNNSVVMNLRKLPIMRSTDYQDNGDLRAVTLDNDFDRLWMAMQQIFLSDSLSLKRPLFGGDYDAHGLTVTNLRDPQNPQDAATMHWVQLQYAIPIEEAKQARDEAVAARDETREIADKFGDVDTAVQLTEQNRILSEAARDQAQQFQQGAEAARDEAEAIVDNDYTFANEPAGIAGTTSGEYFRVPQGVGADISFIYYLNNSGTAVPVAELVGKAAIERQKQLLWELTNSVGQNFFDFVSEGELKSTYAIPLRGDNSPNPKIVDALYWGTLDTCVPISARTAIHNEIGAGRDPYQDFVLDTGKGIGFLPDAFGRFLFVLKPDGKVYFKGGIGGIDATSALTTLKGDVNSKLRAKCAAIKTASVTSINPTLLLTGDSYSDKITIPLVFRNKLQGVYGDGGTGYVSFAPSELLPGVNVSTSGFTRRNLYTCVTVDGTGINGQSIYAAAGVSGSASITGLSGTRLSLYYQDLSGLFTVSIDGGSAVPLGGGGTNTFRAYTVDVAGGTHSVAVASAGGGVVNIFGARASLSSGRGFSILHMGQGGAQATNYGKLIPNLANVAPVIDVDSVIIMLGTNDVRENATPAVYAQNLTALVTAWKNAVGPSVGINIMFAEEVNRNLPAYPDYELAARDVAESQGVGYIDLFNLFPDRATTAALNMFADIDHLNNAGATHLMNFTLNNLLEI
ncbi:GDSL-like Lipase/Acylhydrolase [Serratia entomophila]|uniref:GDSL-type esterase/lipase family protein n=1 Tax=Serratia entomophila TaxID=42906 RepID=UPI00217840A3|nr:GDSL-type esterase/lipase family protein [Serratia entomophila]CAI1774540.1 GDSL-like Lipase/Acylhydrolase [Serratia entomophila]CAI2926319.1 GDSL-like Lipase/Acylhydrolase [Serratia entomophila]